MPPQPSTTVRPRLVVEAAVVGAVTCVVASVVLGSRLDWTFADFVSAFVVSNAVIGLSFASCGAVIFWHRPTNPVGWLMLAGGLAHSISALAAPLAGVLDQHQAPEPFVRVAADAYMFFWPWSIGLFMPLALLLFPSGRLPVGRAWRWPALLIVVTAPVFVAEMVLDNGAPGSGVPNGYLAMSWHDSVPWLWQVSELRTLLALVVGIVALVVRFRQARDDERNQLLWLLAAAAVVVAFVVPWSLVDGTPIAVLFAIPLIPGAIAVAILRYRLLDIRLVVSRLFAWLLVSAGVVGAYVALVAFLDEFVSRQVGRSAVATVLIALVAAPVLPRVQRLVERAFYGQRRDPGRLVSAIGAELRDGPDGFDSVMAALTRALRLSGAELRTSTGSVLARSGTSDGAPHEIPLTVSGDVVGALVVGGRSGERHLTETDRQALELVAVPLALAVQSRQLADAVEESRKRVVAGRAEERRRLRRDLHDGVGPSLTGIAMNADAAANLLGSDPQTAEPLIRRVAADTRESIAEIRRIIEGLRPSVLDGSDLVEAIRLRAESLSSASSGLVIDVHGPPHSRPLDAAVEDAAYRIATEALNNIVKHSSATRADVTVSVGDQEVDIVVQDDGRTAEPWEPGVGLGAMAERAAELGGLFTGGPTSVGGRVHAVIPLASP